MFKTIMEIFTHFNNIYTIPVLIILLSIFAYISKRKNIGIPVLLFILFLLVRFVLLLRIIPINFVHPTHLASVVIVGCAVIRLLFSLVELFFRNKLSFSRVARDAILIIAYVAWGLIILRIEGGINPISFLTTSAVLTLIMGFSMQGTLSNLFAGLSLQLERPYSIGDWIECEDHTGRVLEIGWKSTRIVTKDHELIVIPNQHIIKTPIKNMSKPDLVHIISFKVGVDYDIAPDNVISTLSESLKGINEILNNPKPTVWVKEYSDFAIIYEIRFAHNNFAHEKSLLAEAKRRTWYALKRKGYRIPFPIRDIRPWSEMRKEEGTERLRLNNIISKLIDSTDLFKPLNNEDRTALASSASMLEFAKDENIVTQNDPGSTMYIIASGECDIIVNHKPMAKLTMDNYFGEMSLLTGEPRTATVKATTFVEVVEIKKEDMAKILSSHSSISEDLATILSKRRADLDKNKSHDVARSSSKLVDKIKSFFRL